MILRRLAPALTRIKRVTLHSDRNNLSRMRPEHTFSINSPENNMNRQRHTRTAARTSAHWLVPFTAAAVLSGAAYADNFERVYYDRKADQLVVTMAYRGTNPNHKFSLKWGECQADQADNLPGVTAEVLDDQWKDPERQSYKKTIRFDLSGLPCRRPASVTLRTPPRFFYTLTIPG
jgi:hypothetical protein